MRYPDLSPYSYNASFARPGLLNCGWLGDEIETSAERDASAVDLLTRYLPFRVARTRGLHLCQFCPKPRPGGNDETQRIPGLVERPTRQEIEGCLLGSAEIRVFGSDGVQFAAPDLVVHYVDAHRYALPRPVMCALLSGPQPGSKEFLDLLGL